MRLLHRLGGRRRPCGLRDRGPAGGRPFRHHGRGARSRAQGPLDQGVFRCRGQPVRVLHARHPAPTGVARAGEPTGDPAGGRVGPAGPSVPLHRLAVHRRGRLLRPRPRARQPGPPAPTRPGRAGRSPTRCWRRGGPRSKGRLSRARDPTSSSAVVASPTTRPRKARWSSSETAQTVPAAGLGAARAAAVKVQGRNSTVPLVHPVAVPDGEWALTLQTTWVEPAYLEPDASWCRPGRHAGVPAGQRRCLRRKAAQPCRGAGASPWPPSWQRPVRVLWSREDVVRYGPKRPPLALGLRPDGSGVVRIGQDTRLGRPRRARGSAAPGGA